jgi:hypothetical protein
MNDVKLPWDTVLIDQLDPNDPEDEEVRQIIQRVQAKALPMVRPTPKTPCFGAGIPSQSDELPTDHRSSHPRLVTILSVPVEAANLDGRRRRRRYASRADQQRAYRERKALQASA